MNSRYGTPKVAFSRGEFLKRRLAGSKPGRANYFRILFQYVPSDRVSNRKPFSEKTRSFFGVALLLAMHYRYGSVTLSDATTPRKPTL